MIKRALCALCAVLAPCAPAQEAAAPAADSGMGDYTAFRMERVGRMKASFGQAVGIQEMTGGVSIVLVSDDPTVEALPMKSQSMRFSYREGDGRPHIIVMEGGVDIKHPQANVTSERAEWNFETGDLVFTGNPVMNMPGVKDLRGSKITINLKNQTLDVTDMTASEVDPNATGSGSATPSEPSMLTDADVTDWPGFVETLRAQALSEAPSPGRQIYTRLDPKLQEPLRTLSTEALVGQKNTLIKEFNRILSRAGLYSAPAWDGIALGDEAKALLAKGALTPAEQFRQNRLLIDAAYPQFIRSR
jgi:hypothetical protein